MRRTQVLFDDETYEVLREAAHRRGRSISAVLREMVRAQLDQDRRRGWSYEDLTFIGSGTSDVRPGDPLYPLSEHHDEAWAEDLYEEHLESDRE